MNLSAPFVRRPVATLLLAGALGLLGLIAYARLPVAPLPQVNFPTIQVTATLPGASATTMAASVATPLESQLGQIAGVTDLTSFSAQGATSITIQFSLATDINADAQAVQEALTAASKLLPTTMTTPPTWKKLNPADAPILVLAATSDSLPLTTVDNYVQNVLARDIAQVNGVAQVSIGGEQKPAIRVQVDPAKLAGMGLTLEQIRPALVGATTDAAKGSLDTPDTGFTIAANDQVTTAAAFDNVVVAHRNGASVRVSDIGRAVTAAADRTAAAYYNGKPAILLTIYRQPGANVIDTVRRIEAKLPELSADLPAAISLATVLNRTTTIRASVNDVEFTLALTIVLVVLIVGLFLQNLQATLVPGGTLALVVLGTFAVMAALGFSLDNLSLMGLTIAVGFVVDDAIVVVENVYRHIEAGASPIDAALAGSREIGFTVLAMSLSLIAVLLPIGFMSGIVGRLFRELAFTVIAAVVVSLVASLTFGPMLCSLVARQCGKRPYPAPRPSRDWFDPVIAFYARTLDVTLRHARLMLLALGATVAVTLLLIVAIPKGFFPVQDTGLIQALADASQGVSPRRMQQLERRIDAIVRKDPAVQGVASWTGSTGGNGFAQTANTARYFIVLKPRSERKLSAQQVIKRLQKHLDGISDAVLHMHATQDITVGGRNARGNFEYTLQDPNPAELHTWARRVLAVMRKLPQIEGVASDLQDDAPQLGIHIDRTKAATLGVSIQTIDDTLDDAYGQRQITQYFTEAGTYPIILEIAPHQLHRLASLGDLYVTSSLTNSLVPLSAMVSVDTHKVGPLSVTHQGQFPAVTLSFNLRPRVSLGQAVTAIHRAVAAIHMPASVIGKFQGNASAFQKSLRSMPWLIVLSLLAVYVILGVLYESFIDPLVILSALPAAGLGALLALYAARLDLSTIGIIGIILLIGIVQKNGIMLVDFALKAERETGAKTLDAIRQACLLRLRPILMTTAAATLAGVALAAAHGTGSAFQRPLGFTIVGGLLLSQLLTLYTTPVVYVCLSGTRRRSTKWNAKNSTPAIER
ncbi:MAG: RND efflux system, inner membrane transporter [Rhodanobacteraceae bacterium]|jgi:hydrophobe/amphiphile efflux-1 (HAE1) family protein|nr:MAG: RND efflux system, inner membrane transporter [Rhodanobacteraceae bacterium]